MDDENLIVYVNGKIVGLHYEGVFWIEMGRQSHLSISRRVGLIFYNFLENGQISVQKKKTKKKNKR